MILVPLESLKSADDITWSEHCSRPIENSLEVIEVEWYYETKMGVKTNSEGSRKMQGLSLFFAPIRRRIHVAHAPAQTHESMNIFTPYPVISGVS